MSEGDTWADASSWRGYLARQVRTLLLALGVIVVVLAGGCLFLRYGLGFRPYASPPKVGEPVSKVIARLGPPHFDSRENQAEQSDEYLLGYTDGTGTRYHLTIENGVIKSIKYSSR